MVDFNSLEWQQAKPISEFDDLDWQEAKPMTQSVMDNDDGKVYNVPASMDGISTRYAIDTQHKGADKGNFFGKVAALALPKQMALWNTAQATADLLAGDAQGQGIDALGDRFEKNWRAMDRAVLENIGSLSDTFLEKAYSYQDKMIRLEKIKKGDFSDFGEDLSEEEKANLKNTYEKKVNFVKELRNKNKAFWDKGAQIMLPDKEVDNISNLMMGISSGAISIAEAATATLATKNPFIGSSIIAGIYGAIKDTEYFDKALEAGTDAETASRDAKIAGGIESVIELIGDRLLMSVGKIPQIQKISNRVIESAAVKLAQRKLAQQAVNKGSKHLDNISIQALKGFGVEGGEEGAQQGLGMAWENITGVSDYSANEILGETLWATAIGGLTGAGFGVIGTSIHNREVLNSNNKIKQVLKQINPDIKEEEIQTQADALQEILFQEGASYTKELNTLLEKELEPDTMPEGLTAEKLTADTRKLLREKYGMSDEDIDKTVKASLAVIDARNQFNEVYSEIRDRFEKAGINQQKADAASRLLSARALAVARATKTDAKSILDRWGLEIKHTTFAEFKKRFMDKADGSSALDVLRQDIARLKKGVSRKSGKGLRLSQFIKQQGGIKDDRGDIKSMGATVGLLNKSGISLDEATRLAWEEGYIQGTERPEINQLLDLLSDDLGNKPVYTFDDQMKSDDRQYYLELERAIDEAGADINKDSVEDIAKKLDAYSAKLDSYNRSAGYNETLDDFIPFQSSAVVDKIKNLFKPLAKDIRKYRDFLNKAVRGELNSKTMLQVSSVTPEVYKRLGIEDKPLNMKQSVLKKGNIEKHNVPYNVFEDMPELVSDPILVLDSKTVAGSLVAVLDAQDENGDTVVAIIEPKDGAYNLIPSVHGRENLQNLIDTSVVRYVDKERASKITDVSSLQLRGWNNPQGSLITKDSISQNNENVKGNVQFQGGESITQNENFKKWSKNAPFYPAEKAEEHKFKTGEPLVAEVFHGTKRSDRVGNIFLPERATSGPMAFSTDSKEIATNYSKSKEDTSIYNETEGDYHKYFKVKIPNYDAVTLDRLWRILPYAKRQEVAEKAPHITFDDEAENIIYDENEKRGNGGYETERYRNNALEGLVDSWLMSGSIFGQEEKFIDVMKLAGLGEYDIQYIDPNADYSKVYELYVEMQNPLVTDDIPEKVIKKIEREAKKQPIPNEGYGTDLWDKETRNPLDWAEGLRNGDVYIWTSIPDWVTNILKGFGYDGIVDRGGKGGGLGHNVFIPFYSSQYKSVYNRGTFDEFNPDIRYQDNGGETARGAFYDRVIYLFENADASTIVHEMAHFFLDDMKKFSDNEETAKQLEAVYAYLGSKDGNLDYEQNELFADSFEVYLLEGKSPNQLLARVFANFRKWIGQIYSEVKRLRGVKLDDNIRKTFDEMLGGRSLDYSLQISSQKMAETAASGYISPATATLAVDLLKAGKMSKADMNNLLDRLKKGELKRSEVRAELKKFENNPVKHNEMLNPFDTVKYREALLKDNVTKTKVMEKIDRLMKWAEPKSVNGRLTGRFPNKKMNDFFAAVNEEMKMGKEEARKRMAENKAVISAILDARELPPFERKTILGMRVSETNRPELMNALALENRVLSIADKSISLENAIKLYSDLSDSYNMGRLTANITGDAKKARKQRMINSALMVLTGDGTVNPNIEKSNIKKLLNRTGSSMMSWGGLMDILSMNDKNSKLGQSDLSKMMDVFNEEQKQAQGVADDGENFSKFFEAKLAGANNSAITVSKYINNALDKKTKLEWTGHKKTFTKDELIDVYMKSKDKETRDIMLKDTVNGYSQEFLDLVNQNLTADDRAFADALFDFYDDNWAKINAFYEDKFGVSLPKSEYYSPRSMMRSGISVSDGSPAFATSGFTKARTAKVGASVDIKGAFKVWNNYVVNTNRWLAWADKLVDINSVFGDVSVKKAIENLFGENMNRRIKHEVEGFAGAGGNRFSEAFNGKLLTKIRGNYARSVLALKPALMIKQLTSFPAYWNEMSAKDFATGLADFIAHPKEAIETLGNTTLMKTRGVDIIRDFAEISKMDILKGKKGIKFSDAMMLNIKLGDRGAIYIGGWALYKAELKKNLAKGMKEEEAKAKALEKFERVTDETQQSGRLSQQSYWQSNPALRMFTMFMSSQNQYLRKEIGAVRGLMTGRIDKAQAAKTLFIFHVLLPCLFQFASDGFDWDKKAQLRSAVLGSLNGVFILGTILEKIYDSTLEGNKWNAHRLGVREILPFWGSIEDLEKEFTDIAEGDVDITDMADAFEVFSKVAKPVGEISGLPLKYPLDVIKNFGNYADEGEYGKEIMLYLGWSPYSLRERD